jgi:hypothetical protein
VYGIFATVLGLVAWLYLAAEITVYCAEINVVLARRLWPRSIVQPPLTEADRASLALQALGNQRREEQQVVVTFTDREPGTPAAARTPQTPDEISPPARQPGPGQPQPGPAQPGPGEASPPEPSPAPAPPVPEPRGPADDGEHQDSGT